MEAPLADLLVLCLNQLLYSNNIPTDPNDCPAERSTSAMLLHTIPVGSRYTCRKIILVREMMMDW